MCSTECKTNHLGTISVSSLSSFVTANPFIISSITILRQNVLLNINVLLYWLKAKQPLRHNHSVIVYRLCLGSEFFVNKLLQIITKLLQISY